MVAGLGSWASSEWVVLGARISLSDVLVCINGGAGVGPCGLTAAAGR